MVWIEVQTIFKQLYILYKSKVPIHFDGLHKLQAHFFVIAGRGSFSCTGTVRVGNWALHLKNEEDSFLQQSIKFLLTARVRILLWLSSKTNLLNQTIISS